MSAGKVLVLVESTVKASTLERCLGPGYDVRATMGLLVDLPKSRLGVDVDGGFEPEYLTVRGKADLLRDLRRAARRSSLVLLAQDDDREGEALAWQLRQALAGGSEKGSLPPFERITFSEITPSAVRAALGSPREVDEARAAAQKARRVLDRLVGYGLSPLLWKKVKPGLSAGRVQSAALALVCDREDELESFLPEESWTLRASFRKGRAAFSGRLVALRGEASAFASEALAAQAAADIRNAIADSKARARVRDIRESEEIQAPALPFTTAGLLRAAAERLGFSSKKTMQLAERLYEGLDLGDERVGLISYMRSDSTSVPSEAAADARAYIAERYPAELPPLDVLSPREAEAAEAGSRARVGAIRPTAASRHPDSVAPWLDKDQLRLYALVWERFVASQMNPAKIRRSSADLALGDAIFRVEASRVVEPGFFRLAAPGSRKVAADGERAPELRADEEIKALGVEPERLIAPGPARFTDATIVQALEERGIGRPSTYAPIISLLLDRYYLTRERRQLVPTPLGRITCEMLSESFPELLDAGFTAELEAGLDRIEEGGAEWSALVRAFYGPFKRRVDAAMADQASYRGAFDEATPLVCEKCGKPMRKRLGRRGFFLACSGFPECRNTRSIALATCPRCGGDIVARRKSGGRGREFYGCARYPECDFVTYSRPTSSNCPGCGWFLVEKAERRAGLRRVCINPDCELSRELAAAAIAEASRG